MFVPSNHVIQFSACFVGLKWPEAFVLRHLPTSGVVGDDSSFYFLQAQCQSRGSGKIKGEKTVAIRFFLYPLQLRRVRSSKGRSSSPT